MGLKNPDHTPLKPRPGSKRFKRNAIAEAQKTFRVAGATTAPPLEYDDGISRESGGRGKVKASRTPSIRQRDMKGPRWNGVNPSANSVTR